jgi:hypothetical protein
MNTNTTLTKFQGAAVDAPHHVHFVLSPRPTPALQSFLKTALSEDQVLKDGDIVEVSPSW